MMALAAACSSDDPVIMPEAQSELPMTYHVSTNEALKIAEHYLGTLQEPQTRSKARKVQDIDIVCGNPATRGTGTDTLLYVINYQDEQGFAIVGADTRAMPIYAMSDTGNFQLDENSNEGLKVFFEKAKQDAAKRIASDQVSFQDPLLNAGVSLPGLYDDISPMISKHQSRVGITDEYCKYVVNDSGEPARTCCVPIGVEIFMSYHKWPQSLKGHTFDWDNMNAGNDNDGIARALAILSSADYFHVRNNTAKDNGSVFLSNIIPGLKKCQYTLPYDSYSLLPAFTTDRTNSEIHNLLKSEGPLLVEGRSSMPDEQGNGHLWVIDGLKQCHKLVFEGSLSKMELFDMYHCIWGDNGRSNGYYLAEGNFFDESPDAFDPIDNGEVETGWEWRYFGKVVYFKNLKPNK